MTPEEAKAAWRDPPEANPPNPDPDPQTQSLQTQTIQKQTLQNQTQTTLQKQTLQTQTQTLRPRPSRPRPSDPDPPDPDPPDPDPQALRPTQPWYCEDCQQCEECEIYKPIEGNFGDDGYWHYSKRCLTCEHPLCTHCPKYRHPHTKIAVQRRHKVKDQWFCKRTAACTKAHAAARKAANNKS
jgi:hypothetical protein